MRARAFAAVVFVLLIHLLSSTSQAEWNDKAYAYGSQAFKGFPGPNKLGPEYRGAIATVWGGGLRGVKLRNNIHHDERQVKLPAYFAKDLKVYLHPARRAGQAKAPATPLKAPLLVFVPGVFGSADQIMAQAMIGWLSDLGYSVLTVPNAWSKDYQSAMPFHKSEFPNDEANAIIELSRWAVHELGEKNVMGVYLAGESLGALTSAIAYEKDSNSPAPVFTGGLTLLWPPIKLTSSVNTLDDMIAKTTDLYRHVCRTKVEQVKILFRVLTGNYLSGPTAKDVQCAPAIVAQFSFRKQLIELAKTIASVEKRDVKVSDDLDFHSFIRGYANRYAPALDETDERGYLGYWIKEMNPDSLKRVQIISSVDDFVNASESWRDVLAAGLSDQQLLLLNWGGHIGATNTPEFKSLIDLQYAQAKRITLPKPAADVVVEPVTTL